MSSWSFALPQSEKSSTSSSDLWKRTGSSQVLSVSDVSEACTGETCSFPRSQTTRPDILSQGDIINRLNKLEFDVQTLSTLYNDDTNTRLNILERNFEELLLSQKNLIKSYNELLSRVVLK